MYGEVEREREKGERQILTNMKSYGKSERDSQRCKGPVGVAFQKENSGGEWSREVRSK